MHAETGLLAVAGSVCMMLALVLAWCLAGVRSSRLVKKCFPNPQYLLKAHLDFLMMTGLLFVFFLLFGQLRLTPPTAIVVAMSLGSVGNPSGFLALAIRHDLPQKPATPFGALMVPSSPPPPSGMAAPRGTWRTPSFAPSISDRGF
jgi:O-antigen ligase